MAFDITKLDFILPNGWELVRLGDIADINANTISKKDKFNIIKYIDISSISTHSMEKPKEILFNEAPSRARRKLKNNDFIISTVRPNLKQYVFLKTVEPNWIASTGFCVVSAKNSKHSWYLYSLVTSEKFTEYLSRVANGGAYPAFNPVEIEDAIIPLPDDKYLGLINSFAQNINEKIQLNTQTNQTLEAIAQAIFKSWFVDFDPVRAKAAAILDGKTRDEANLSAMAIISGKVIEDLSQTEYQELWEIADAFPSELVENTEFGEVPKGWEYQRADSLFDIGIGKTPPRKESEWFSESSNDMEWISIKDMGNQGMFITESSEYLIHEAVDKFNIRKIPENTVILSFKLTVGRVSVTTKETTTNEAIAHFKLLEKSKLSTEFLYCYFRNYDFNNLGSTSSIATAVNSKTIKGIEILNPSEEVIKYFNLYIKNIFNKIKENTIQSSKLIQTRDLLLPKLLNGEIEL